MSFSGLGGWWRMNWGCSKYNCRGFEGDWVTKNIVIGGVVMGI